MGSLLECTRRLGLLNQHFRLHPVQGVVWTRGVVCCHLYAVDQDGDGGGVEAQAAGEVKAEVVVLAFDGVDLAG